MNKQRRKELNEVKERLVELKDRLEELEAEEQDYLDNMPENFQCGEKGETAEEAICALSTAQESIDEAMEAIDEATGEE